jgi:hypothetical protein
MVMMTHASHIHGLLSAFCQTFERSRVYLKFMGVTCSWPVQGCMCKDESGNNGLHVHARDGSHAVRRLQGILYQREQQMHRHQNRIHLLEQQLQVCSFCAMHVTLCVQLVGLRQCVCASSRSPYLSLTGQFFSLLA